MTVDPNAQSAPTQGFFSALFDLSFTSFITLRFIKLIFVVGLIVISVAALGFIAVAASEGGAAFFFGLILAAVAWLFYIVMMRVSLEVIAVLFRISEHTKKMADSVDGPQV